MIIHTAIPLTIYTVYINPRDSSAAVTKRQVIEKNKGGVPLPSQIAADWGSWFQSEIQSESEYPQRTITTNTIMKTPLQYKPTHPNDFIGDAHGIAKVLEKLIETQTQEGQPQKLLFLGKPGIGKTALVDWFLDRVKIDRFCSVEFNGAAFKVDNVAAIEDGFAYRQMLEGYKAIRIEEVDKVPHVAQVRMLTMLDNMPKNTMFIATSNCGVGDLEERFQSRFMVFQPQPPSADQIFDLLTNKWTIATAAARHIAEMACGNVRQALLDANLQILAA